jgi:biopolymer transport protein TolR
MGFSNAAAGRTGGRRRRGVPRYRAMCEINMTPFIDVMLVLLIIFMVAAPLLATGVPIDLPQTKASSINVDQKPLSVSIDDKGAVFIMDQQTATGEIVDRLKSLSKDGFDERIYVRGATSVNYGRVMEVTAMIASAGFKKVAMVTRPEGK